MSLEAKYRHSPEPQTLDLSDLAVESDAYEAAVNLESVAGFLRVLASLEHVEGLRDWLGEADQLDALAEVLSEEVAAQALARQQEAEGQ